jgi:UDP-N-acetylglucosamine 4,6-dehydratase
MAYDFLKGKSILVTGGTGSFGQRFVRTLLEKTQVARIVVFSRDELKQSQMESTIPDPDKRLRFFLGDVRDLERLQRAFHGVDYIVHAAALKQVPMLEYNPFEAVKTNILGTQNVINAAVDQGVEKVLLVSTDKAANPANLYGATKLCAERLMISGNAYGAGKTTMSVVRYGNVFGSRGSILHVIDEQKKTGVLSLTHEDMTRFWITLDQGIELVIMGLENMKGGEIFIPKIPSMKVKDFMTTLAPGCEIKVTGIRPGEKLHEVLVTVEEARHALELEKHYVILPEHGFSNMGATRENYQNGKELPENFFYSSLNNNDWLSSDKLKDFLLSL